MAGIIITFRFKETPTSNTRRQNLYNFLSSYPNTTIEEQTTSTIICKTNKALVGENNTGIINDLLTENAKRTNDDKILINEDNILFIRISENKIIAIKRILNLVADDANVSQIKKIFVS